MYPSTRVAISVWNILTLYVWISSVQYLNIYCLPRSKHHTHHYFENHAKHVNIPTACFGVVRGILIPTGRLLKWSYTRIQPIVRRFVRAWIYMYFYVRLQHTQAYSFYGITPPFAHMPSWWAQGHKWLYLPPTHTHTHTHTILVATRLILLM